MTVISKAEDTDENLRSHTLYIKLEHVTISFKGLVHTKK